MKGNREWSRADIGQGIGGVVVGALVSGVIAYFASNKSENAHEANMRTLRENNRAFDATIAELKIHIDTLRAQTGDLAEKIVRGRELLARVEREFGQNKNAYDQLKPYVEALRSELHNAENRMPSGMSFN